MKNIYFQLSFLKLIIEREKYISLIIKLKKLPGVTHMLTTTITMCKLVEQLNLQIFENEIK